MSRRYGYNNRDSKLNYFTKRKQQPFIRQKKNKTLEKIKEQRLKSRIVENVQGLKVKEYEYEEMHELINKINKQNQVKYESIKNKKLISYGQETEMTVADRIAMESHSKTMGSLYSQKYGYLKGELLNRFHQFESKKEFKEYLNWLKKRSNPSIQNKKLQTYKSNYIKSLFKAYGDTADIRAIVNKIKNMKPKKVEETYLVNEQAYISYSYNDSDEYAIKIETLKNIWLGSDINGQTV